MKSPIVLLFSLLQDCSRLLPDVKGLERDFITLKNRFEHEGIGFLAVALPTLCDALDYGLAHGKFTCPSTFSKGKKTGALPKLFSGLLCNVFDSQGLLKSDASVEHIKMLREVLRFFKKVVLTSKRTKELSREAIKTFVETDESLARVKFDDRRTHSLSLVCRVILPTLDLFGGERSLRHRHGPGGVYERVSGNGKWKSLFKLLPSSVPDSQSFDFGEFLYLSDRESALEETYSYTPFGGRARYICVPKTAVAVRGITVEPLLNQFKQQGLNEHLRREIEGCPVLSSCLALTDQSKNQELALAGSLTGEWTTIDLSSASDLLSLDLVKQIFQHRPAFLEQLISCRSNIVELEKEFLNIRKFAGMGNATTFPVQSVTFACLCICAMLEYEGKSPTYKNVVRSAGSIRVFGDDIIVRTEYYDLVRDWITSFGLKVNEGKTFSKGNFRESCGLDAFKGYDVTPTYIRSDPDKSASETTSLLNTVSTSNQLWLKGLYSTSQSLRDIVEKSLKKRLPMVSRDSGLVGWHDRFGSTEAHSWDSDLQTLRTEGLRALAKKVKDPIDGYPALLKFFNTPLIERGIGHLRSSSKRFNTRLVKSWAPAKAG